MSVCVLSSGHEVQRSASLCTAASEFSARCCYFPTCLKVTTGMTNGEFNTVNMCRHVAKSVAFYLREIASDILNVLKFFKKVRVELLSVVP